MKPPIAPAPAMQIRIKTGLAKGRDLWPGGCSRWQLRASTIPVVDWTTHEGRRSTLARRPEMTDLQFRIRPAIQEDRDAVLSVMEPWNMHHVPSPEMEALDLDCFFIAEVDGVVVGASGFRLLGAG